jgi:3-isopropylmalate/(R)-2-methylmalate dehydratase small subunit
MDAKRVKITGRGIAVRGNDIDTDRIIPARFLRCVTFDGIGEHAFEDDRKSLAEKGETHPFDDPRHQDAQVLLVNKNFGCGSSREHAPQSLMRWGEGIQAIVGESFAEIFFGNCVALGIPCLRVSEDDAQRLQSACEAKPDTEFTIDVGAQAISWEGGSVPAEIADGPRRAFLEGKWDTTMELMAAKDEIRATAAKLPYFDGWK